MNQLLKYPYILIFAQTDVPYSLGWSSLGRRLKVRTVCQSIEEHCRLLIFPTLHWIRAEVADGERASLHEGPNLLNFGFIWGLEFGIL